MLAVVNADAGSAEREAIEAACEQISDAPCALEVATTSSPDDLGAALERLDGRDLLVIGGDGSVHLAVARLRAAGLLTDTVVGLVPLGTGNDLARSLGIDLDPRAAAMTAVDGVERSIDLVVDSGGEIAVNAVHAGVGAEAARRSSDRKEGLGALAYPLGAISAGAAVGGWRVAVDVDGQALAPSEGEATLMVGIGNGATIGGGTPLLPDAEVDDGLLDVLVANAIAPAARATFATALLRGTHVDRDDVAVARGREISISGEAMPYNIDGELTGEATERIFHVEPAAWRIRAPGPVR